MALIPPQPVGVLPGSGFWNDWIEKIRVVINGIQTNGITWTLISGKPTTIAGFGITDPIEYTTNKNANGGYAGLTGARITKGADTQDDIVIDLATKGLVLKDTQGTPHYWRITISNVGAIVITDLGTTKP
jgi:hypothetical protein